jgi:hypothetical protein
MVVQAGLEPTAEALTGTDPSAGSLNRSCVILIG